MKYSLTYTLSILEQGQITRADDICVSVCVGGGTPSALLTVEKCHRLTDLT